jgi:hypothetical protein
MIIFETKNWSVAHKEANPMFDRRIHSCLTHVCFFIGALFVSLLFGHSTAIAVVLGAPTEASNCTQITDGTSINGSISFAGAEECYNFTGAIGDIVTVFVDNLTTGGTRGMRLTILKPDGSTLGYTDYSCCNQDLELRDRVLPVAGTYTIIVDGYGDATGPYTLGFTRKTIIVIQVTPTALNFGKVPRGNGKELTVLIKNTGSGTATGNATTAAPFSIVSGGSYNLAPNQSQVVTIQYRPTSPGIHTGAVTFACGHATLPVTGEASNPIGLPWQLLLLGN